MLGFDDGQDPRIIMHSLGQCNRSIELMFHAAAVVCCILHAFFIGS